ncbi:MAG: DNA polymerase III subunit beta [Chloroflexi bacterium]|nr:DNA polymerase III subunit beta [Chloroflexota bacterium]
MKISCLQENLNKGLGTVGRAVATRTTLPITQNILLQTDQGRLKLSATNLEIAITCWIGANIEEEGAITVPSRLLTELVNSLPSERVDLSLTPRGRSLKISCARFQANLSGLDATDFPPIPQVGDGKTCRLDPEALRLAISQVAFAAATEDSRPVLTGIQMDFQGNSLTLAGADGFRLAVHHMVAATPLPEITAVILPARALSELHRLLAGEADPVEVAVNPNHSQVLFRMHNAEMVSQVIQGTFPNYQQLIPTSCTTRAMVDVEEFLRATKSAAIFARDGSGIVRLHIKPGQMSVSARSEEIGDNEGEIDAQVEGPEAKIAFNSHYLLDVLGAMPGPQVTLETTNPSSPGVFKPVGADNYVHVVMPMFVQW